MAKRFWELYFTLFAFLPTPVVLGLARLGPVGLLRPGPGTWGSLLGLLVYTAFFYPQSAWVQWLFMAVLLIIALGACHEAEVRLAKRDPSEVVLDEFAAIPLCFLGLTDEMRFSGAAWPWFLAAFVLFRLFDIFKPLVISKLQNLPGGWGVLMDDVAAALATCLILHVLARMHWLG